MNQVIELLNTLLIIAGGLCYIMTPEEITPISVFGISYSTILKAKNNMLILQDDVKLTIIQQDGNFWHTDRISFGGIKNLEVKDNLITGLSYDQTNSFQEWSKFTLDLYTKVLTGGSYRDYI